VVLVFKDSAGEPMSAPKQVVLWTWPLLLGAIAWVRFGTTWGLLEGIAVYSWWLTMIFGRAGAASWLRRHLITTFVLFVFVFATLFFAFPALLLGTVLSVWWCWALGLSAGMIVTVLLWPAQRRFCAQR
jgi:hypothetical protein